MLALAYLLEACGAGSTGSLPPSPSSIASDTPIAAPARPALPTAAAAPTIVSRPTVAPLPTASIPPTAISQVGAANLLISYHKSGGFAGVDEMITVYTDGTIELRDKQGSSTTKADPSALQALQKLLDSPEFAALQISAWPPAADQFVYELTVAGRAKPIVTADSADNPPVLREVIGALEQLKTQAK